MVTSVPQPAPKPHLRRLRGFIVLVAGACASTTTTPRTSTAPSSQTPVVRTEPRLSNIDSVLQSLSIRDKAAQLVWPQVFADYTPANSPSWLRVERFITQDHVGGFIMSVGSPTEMAEKLNAMQRMSALPLLIGADLEFGAGFRARGGYFLPNAIDLGGATIFPYQMGIGATRDTALAYEQGRITALEGRALGIHLAFTPILDVNNNPANPVIGPRSFGENPKLDATLGRALIRGIQEHGMLATAKHFPGHGDTDQNSHLTVPTISASRARIDSVELVPFRAAIDAGVGAIMTFHGMVPALGAVDEPATLSPSVMTDLLRKQLGFKGLLVTDAMDMNGVLASVKPGKATQTISGNYGTVSGIGLAEACKRALEAGADILLMPSDVPGAIDAVVAGVQEGRLTEARLDASVRRVLELKQRFGLDRARVVDLDSVRAIVGDTANVAIARRAAEQSMTLVKDSLSLVPVQRSAPGTPGVLSITVARRTDLGAGSTFNAELRRALGMVREENVNADDQNTNFDRLLHAADSARVVILSSYLAQSSTTATASAPDALVTFIHGLLRRNPRTVVVAFGNPYFLQQIPEASAYLVAWGGFPLSQRAAALALAGANSITGHLPISIPPLSKFGDGIDRIAPAMTNPRP
jgi:beta-N-acetylhexosaminidase